MVGWTCAIAHAAPSELFGEWVSLNMSQRGCLSSKLQTQLYKQSPQWDRVFTYTDQTVCFTNRSAFGLWTNYN